MKKQHILCPVDFSGSSVPAVNLAAKLAIAEPAKIFLVHVNDPNAPAASLEDAQVNAFCSDITDRLLSHQNIEFEHVTLRGKPSTAIIDFARKRSVDLIVMGTHGRTGLARVIVGSVAQSVMTDAPCTVVTVKLPDSPKPSSQDSLAGARQDTT